MRRSPAAKGRWNAIAAECRAVAAATPRKGGGTVALQGFEDLSPSPAAVPPDAACPFLGKELWLNAEGVIAPCCGTLPLGSKSLVLTGAHQHPMWSAWSWARSAACGRRAMCWQRGARRVTQTYSRRIQTARSAPSAPCDGECRSESEEEAEVRSVKDCKLLAQQALNRM
jgi:hypothetical protein